MRVCLLLLVLLVAPLARGDTGGTHLLGERLAGTAGAGVALADEPTGGVRNPAGLGAIPGIQASVSVSAYQLFIQRQESALRVGERDLDLEVIRFTAFPAALGVAVPLTDGGPAGRHVLAIDVLVPEARNVGGHVETDPDDATETSPGTALSFESRSRTFQFAAAWGWAASDTVRVGAMVSYSLTEVDQTSRLAIEPADGSFQIAASSVAGLAGSLSFDAGFQITVDPAWIIGASLRTASLHLHGAGEGTTVTALSSAPGRDATERIELHAVDVRRLQPWRVALGGAWLGPDGLRVAADLYVHIAQAPYLDIEDPDLPAFDGLGRVDQRQPYGENRGRLTTFDGAVGIEGPVSEDVVLRGGLLSSLSAWPAPDPLDPRHPARIHQVGATFGVALPSEHGAMSLSLCYLVGFGEGLAARAEVGGDVRFEVVDVVQHHLTAVLGGAVRF